MVRYPSFYCKTLQVHVILPLEQIKKDASGKWLIIGYSGVDGIEFRVEYLEIESKVYAYYPIESEFCEIAKNADDLILKWENGKNTSLMCFFDIFRCFAFLNLLSRFNLSSIIGYMYTWIFNLHQTS